MKLRGFLFGGIGLGIVTVIMPRSSFEIKKNIHERDSTQESDSRAGLDHDNSNKSVKLSKWWMIEELLE